MILRVEGALSLSSLRSKAHAANVRRGQRDGWVRVRALLEFGFLGAFPVGALTTFLILGRPKGNVPGDFGIFWLAGRDILAGRSPYPTADPAVLAIGHSFVYPAPAGLLMVLPALLPWMVVVWPWTIASLCAVFLSLWVVGVRDWRCFGAAFASEWVFNSIVNRTLTPFLMLGLAILWINRDRGRRAACALAALVVTKVFLAPLFLWLLLTRRPRTAGLAASLTALLALVGWSAIGFAGFTGYPHLLATLASAEQRMSYSPLSLALAAGLSVWAARLVVLIIAAGVVAWALRAKSRLAMDESGFAAALVVALVLSPIVWPHYFTLLFPVIGILHRRFGLAWLVPLLSWATPGAHSPGLTQTAIALTVAIATVALILPRRVNGDPGGTATTALGSVRLA